MRSIRRSGGKSEHLMQQVDFSLVLRFHIVDMPVFDRSDGFDATKRSFGRTE